MGVVVRGSAEVLQFPMKPALHTHLPVVVRH